MSVNNIKTGVVSSLLSVPIEDQVDRLILSCLLYDYTSQVLDVDNSLQNNIRALVDTYVASFIKKLNELKTSFVSYDLMRSKIASFKKDNFFSFSLNNIQDIATLYKDKTQIKNFSINYFSQFMYKLLNISDYQYKRLFENHFKVMVPIMRYYIDTYGLLESDMEILSALGYAEKPGKEIIFKIKNIDSPVVISDMKLFRIPLRSPDDFYSIKIDGEYVKLITN
jgi:hypothetical protein